MGWVVACFAMKALLLLELLLVLLLGLLVGALMELPVMLSGRFRL